MKSIKIDTITRICIVPIDFHLLVWPIDSLLSITLRWYRLVSDHHRFPSIGHAGARGIWWVWQSGPSSLFRPLTTSEKCVEVTVKQDWRLNNGLLMHVKMLIKNDPDTVKVTSKQTTFCSTRRAQRTFWEIWVEVYAWLGVGWAPHLPHLPPVTLVKYFMNLTQSIFFKLTIGECKESVKSLRNVPSGEKRGETDVFAG